MKQHNLLSKHPWMMPFGILVLILGPVILYFALQGAGVPATVVVGIVLLVAAKHLGVLAVISAPAYALLRRRSPHSKPDQPNSPNRALQTPHFPRKSVRPDSHSSPIGLGPRPDDGRADRQGESA